MAGNELSELLRQASQKERERVAKEIVDTQIKILTALYDKAIAYTNVVIIGGYASFFGMWSFTKDYLSTWQAVWSALMMSVSIVIFVSFEIVKMTFTSRSLLARGRAMGDPAATQDPNEILARLRDFDLQSQRETIRFGKFWTYTLVVTVSPAVVAIAILFYGFITRLIQ